ncbi:GntR family transcriptional regulator [Nonomuraea sp. NPDC050394]|uniref:GntR family transcriptional regulator n=1 Tax=Nonomuraea sp. NPDC050394 TaxID=3364363 RepID=UPI0037A013F7
MSEPAYIRIACEYAKRIRGGELPSRAQLPSYKEIAEENGVSDIVVRKALDLLKNQGLVRAVPRRGVFVADQIERQSGTSKHTMADAPDEPGAMLDALAVEISKLQTRLTEIERVHTAKLDEILSILRAGDSPVPNR